MSPIVWTQHDATEIALRTFGIRRSSSRNAGAGRAFAFRRSVGAKPTSSSGAGTIVPGSVGWVITATAPYYTLATDGEAT